MNGYLNFRNLSKRHFSEVFQIMFRMFFLLHHQSQRSCDQRPQRPLEVLVTPKEGHYGGCEWSLSLIYRYCTRFMTASKKKKVKSPLKVPVGSKEGHCGSE